MRNKFVFICLTTFMLNYSQEAIQQEIAINKYIGLFDEPNTYFNDSDSEFNKFVGTWKWEQGLSSLTIKLEKKYNVFVPELNNNFDLLVGEYKYTDSTGVVVINTIPNLDNNLIQPFNRNIWGYNIFKARPGNPLNPNNAATNIEYNRVQLNFQDPERPYLISVIKMRFIDTTVPKIEILLTGYGIQTIEPGQFFNMRVPEEFYTLTKQP